MHVVVSLGNALHVGSKSCLYEFTELNFSELLVCWVPAAPQDVKYIDLRQTLKRDREGLCVSRGSGTSPEYTMHCELVKYID